MRKVLLMKMMMVCLDRHLIQKEVFGLRLEFHLEVPFLRHNGNLYLLYVAYSSWKHTCNVENSKVFHVADETSLRPARNDH